MKVSLWYFLYKSVLKWTSFCRPAVVFLHLFFPLLCVTAALLKSENDLEVVKKETQVEGEGDTEEEEEACIATPVEASAEEEEAAVASTIGLPDLDYDSAIESDCESDHDFW